MNEKNNSKKKIPLRFIFIALITLVIIFAGFRFMVFPDGFEMPMDYEKDYFGKTYSELYSLQSRKEKKVGEEIVERARSCMEYNGDEALAPETDKLSRFYYFPYFERPVRTEVDISLKKAVLHGESGSVWFRYSLEWFDENGKIICDSADILTRCTIEKDDSGNWIVTSVNEPP